MRRYQREIIYRPRCRNAGRSWWLARFALAVCLLAAVLLRYGFINAENAFVVFYSGFAIAALALLLAVAAFVRIWRADDRGFTKAFLGFICAFAILATPVALQIYLFMKPGSNDITTDIIEVPPFSRSRAAFDFRGGTIPETPAELTLARQAEANPDIGSLVIDTDSVVLFQQVQEIARNQGWTVVSAVSPGGARFGDGHVDMAAQTALLRLPVDMTVRIRPTADGTRVDIRCTSRYRHYDISDNTAIVRGLIEELAKGPPLG